eukprot:s5399_g3.t1
MLQLDMGNLQYQKIQTAVSEKHLWRNGENSALFESALEFDHESAASGKNQVKVPGTCSGAVSSTCSSCENRPGASTGVRVAVRIRPLVAREAGQRQGVRSSINGKVTLLGLDRQERCFLVDHEAVFQALGAELVRKAAEGYNTCMLAYGHTGGLGRWELRSGKTYTMMGSEFTTDVLDELSPCATSITSEALRAQKGTSGTPRTPMKEKLVVQTPLERGPLDDAFNMEVTTGSGLIPRTLEAIFATLRQEDHMGPEEPDTVCIASFYELHNERVRDLLAPMLPKEAPAWQDLGM